MNGPPRLLDEGATETERALLQAAVATGPSERWMRQTRAALGLTAGLATASNSLSAAASSKLGAALVLKWLGASLATAALVGSVAFVIRERPKPAPEPVGLPAIENEVVVAPNDRAPDLAATPVEAAPLVAPATAPPRLAPPKQNPKTLGLEIAALDAVKQSVVARNPAAALNGLAKYHADFPAPLLGPEATVLEVQALMSDGDSSHRARAIALARRFVKMHPTSPHAPRLETLVSNPGQP